MRVFDCPNAGRLVIIRVCWRSFKKSVVLLVDVTFHAFHALFQIRVRVFGRMGKGVRVGAGEDGEGGHGKAPWSGVERLVRVDRYRTLYEHIFRGSSEKSGKKNAQGHDWLCVSLCDGSPSVAGTSPNPWACRNLVPAPAGSLLERENQRGGGLVQQPQTLIPLIHPLHRVLRACEVKSGPALQSRTRSMCSAGHRVCCGCPLTGLTFLVDQQGPTRVPCRRLLIL